jgi:hypothetical protein
VIVRRRSTDLAFNVRQPGNIGLPKRGNGNAMAVPFEPGLLHRVGAMSDGLRFSILPDVLRTVRRIIGVNPRLNTE